MRNPEKSGTEQGDRPLLVPVARERPQSRGSNRPSRQEVARALHQKNYLVVVGAGVAGLCVFLCLWVEVAGFPALFGGEVSTAR